MFAQLAFLLIAERSVVLSEDIIRNFTGKDLPNQLLPQFV